LWLAGSRGIRQFIDIGSGLPAQNNTHQAVQKAAPEARVVYADHDRLVGAYAGALLTGDGSRWSYAGVARLPRSSRPGRAGPR
jgi:hypothetical protein